MNKLKILVFTGSIRKESINQRLAYYISKELRKLEVDVNHLDIRNFPLPLYNPDYLPEEFPENAKKLAIIMQEHNIWIIVTPEYNYSIPSTLKNLIDFVSRSPNNQPNRGLFPEKIIGIASASPSMLGGAKAAKQLRETLTTLGSIVIPSQANIANAYSAFDLEGNLNNELDKKAVNAVLKQLINIGSKLSN
ncbi:MAG: NAD(P)H-dependent oxidoreductase [Pseudomonadota bacterium]